jgi:arabinose-5-phosphate isomerase
MVLHVLKDQQKYINSFFDKLDVTQVENIVQRLLVCRGSILISGVGKSGHIAQKIAATFASIGVRSYFLSPTEAMHGALGTVQAGDLLLAFSKSGETKELLSLIPFVRARGVETVAVVSRLASQLEGLCERTVLLPVEREICPHDLAPTISTAVQLLFGDCLAVAFMQRRSVTAEGFAENHPAGLLGKLSQRVSDLMLRGEDIPVCRGEQKLLDLLPLLSSKRCGTLLIVDGKMQLQGIFTDGDLRRAIEKTGGAALNEPVASFMTKAAKSIAPEALAKEAIHRMEEEGKLVSVLPVLQGQTLVGLIRMWDILKS